MTRADVRSEYFEWLFQIVCGNRYSEQISYRKLLMYLHDIDFRYLIPKDQNRAEDGIELRYRFAVSQGYRDSSNTIMRMLSGPCSVLEMMVALAIRCEENIMDDPDVGDRTGQWFWGMVNNLGLGSMYDRHFDEPYVEEVIDCFLERDYAPDGKGGLFTVRNYDRDLRDVEIWHQLCWFLDSIT